MKLLLIDSDPRSIRYLHRFLREDYICDIAKTATEAENFYNNSSYDVIILELLLPDMDGEDLCSLIKSQFREMPVIVISSKSKIEDKEYAFNKGADDYIVKPFLARELIARIKVQLRKRYQELGFHDEAKVMTIRDITLDRMKRSVYYKQNRLDLRKKEFRLLEFLILNNERVVTRGEILENVWDSDASMFTNTVDVHMKRLRDKIDKKYREKYINTVHGIGYFIE